MFNKNKTVCDEYSIHVGVSLLYALCIAFNKIGLSVKLLSQNVEVIGDFINDRIKLHFIDCGYSDYKFSYNEAVSFSNRRLEFNFNRDDQHFDGK